MSNSNNSENNSARSKVLLFAGIGVLALIMVVAGIISENAPKNTANDEANKQFLSELKNNMNNNKNNNNNNDNGKEPDDPDGKEPDPGETVKKEQSGAGESVRDDPEPVTDSNVTTETKVENNESAVESDKSTGTDNKKDDDTDSIIAPNFTVYTKNEKKVTLHEKFGKPIIINFWATWCGPCKMEMPHFEKAYKEYKDKIEFMMINPTDGYNDTHKSVDKFINDNGYTFPVYRDTKSDAITKYGISAFPTTFFIDSNGYLLGYYTGTMNEETLYACIDIVMGNAE